MKDEENPRPPMKPPLPEKDFPSPVSDLGHPQLHLRLVGKHSDPVTKQLSKHQLIYSILGLVLGCVCVIGGLVLFLEGVSGNMNWTAKFLVASSRILNAAPGAVLFIVGLFIVYLTRYNVKSER